VLPLAPAALGGVEVAPVVPAVVPPAVVPPAVAPPVVPPAAVLDEGEPDEDDIDALVRMKLDSDELGVLVVPLVPVAPDVALDPR